MLLAPHTITAGVIGERIGDPVWAFLTGFIIHFLLDSIPHYDLTDEGRMTPRQIGLVVGDALIALIIILLVIKPEFSLMNPFWWGALGGNLPDMFDNAPVVKSYFWRTNFGRRFHRFHEKIQHWRPTPGPVPGLLVQYLVVALALILQNN